MLSVIRGNLLFVGTGVFALGILYGTFSSLDWKCVFLNMFVGMLCVVLGMSESEKNRKLKTFLCVLGILFVVFPMGEVRAALAPHALPSVYVLLLNNPISLTGTIVADPDIRVKNQQLFISVNKNGQHTNILAFAPLFQQFASGERVLIAGTLTAPTPFDTTDGREFRYDNFLAKKDTFAMVPQADILEVGPPTGINKLADFLFDCKHDFVSGLSHALSDPYAELATGLLTGDQHQLPDAIVAMLACSGLIWVVVLSGYHVTLLAEGVRRIFSFLPNRFSYTLAGVSIVGIIFATGASAPSLRGGVMACLTLFSRATNRRYDALRALCFALIAILLWNPLLLAYDPGFQLSIVVTPALLLVTPLLELKLLWIKSELIRESIAVSTVAQFACLPLILWQTGELGVWAIPANILVMALVPFAMITSVAAGVFGVVIPAIAPAMGLPSFGVLYYILTVAKFTASLPYATTIIPEFSFVFVVGMYVLLGLFVWTIRQKETKPASARIRAEAGLVLSPETISPTRPHSKIFSQ